MFPTISFSSMFASSSADVTSGMTYFLPIIYVAFAVAAVIAVTRLIIFTAHWIGDKVSNLGNHNSNHRDYGVGSPTEFQDLRDIYSMRKR